MDGLQYVCLLDQPGREVLVVRGHGRQSPQAVVDLIYVLTMILIIDDRQNDLVVLGNLDPQFIGLAATFALFLRHN